MRKHAFPISQPKLRVLDNDVVNSLGDGLDFSEGGYFNNEEGNVTWGVSPDAELRSAYVFLDKKDREVLIDFDETPDDVYSEILGNDPDDPLSFTLAFGDNRQFGAISNFIPVGDNLDLRLEVGSVFCVGVKNKAEPHTVRAYLLYASLKNEYLFRTGGFYGGNNYAAIGVGDWLTFMFDGKRLVCLGSNSWV